jgi:hypothetical protein
MKKILKKILRIFIPKIILKKRRNYLSNQIKIKYKKLTIKEVFNNIYHSAEWGKSKNPEQKFFSGEGSSNISIVSKYIDGVNIFLESFSSKPDVVDLGCGDFLVGSKIRSLCGLYIACDIVAPLIEYNKKKYQTLNVDFRTLDLTHDNLPSADVVFIRQVLQHLSNSDIKNIIPKLAQNYKYLVLTEHLPITENFIHNLDMDTGPNLRLELDSGVVLTSPPFNLEVEDKKIMFEVPLRGGVVTTTIYKLKTKNK